jgi:hypothetical protein
MNAEQIASKCLVSKHLVIEGLAVLCKDCDKLIAEGEK